MEEGMNIKAFTYLIKNMITNQWYYGVRYSKNCKTTDLFTIYFSSSKYVNEDILKYGAKNFYFEIRKTFDNIEKARIWEYKVLRRMNVIKRKDCYNKHQAPHPPIMLGDENPSKRNDVRLKLSIMAKKRGKHTKETLDKIKRKKTIKNIAKLIKKGLIISKSKRKMYEKYYNFVINEKPNCVLVTKTLYVALDKIYSLPKYVKPEKRKKPKISSELREKINNKIKNSNSKKRYYTSPCLTELLVIDFDNEKDIPEGWIKGNKLKSRNQKIKKSSMNRKHNEKTKKKLSDNAKKKIYCTSPDLKTLKVVYNEEDIPEGWIKGNKLKSRNQKISSYLKNERWKND